MNWKFNLFVLWAVTVPGISEASIWNKRSYIWHRLYHRQDFTVRNCLCFYTKQAGNVFYPAIPTTSLQKAMMMMIDCMKSNNVNESINSVTILHHCFVFKSVNYFVWEMKSRGSMYDHIYIVQGQIWNFWGCEKYRAFYKILVHGHVCAMNICCRHIFFISYQSMYTVTQQTVYLAIEVHMCLK